MTLCLHAGASPIDYDGLRQLETPMATATHVPLPHHRFVDLVAGSLTYFGHEVTERHFGVTPDGNRFFSVLHLRSPYTNYTDMVALRNSHDKSLSALIGFGSEVFCCDNTALHAAHIVKVKHTTNLKMRLPGLVNQLIEPIAEQREAQHRTMQLYQHTPVNDQLADHLILQMFRDGIITVTRIPEMLEQWHNPAYAEWGDRTLYRLLNAATFLLKGRVIEDAQLTPRLHQILDAVAEPVTEAA